MNLRWIERLTKEGREAQAKRDREARDRFEAIVFARFCAIAESEAMRNPTAQAMAIEREEARRHPFLYAVHLWRQWRRDIR